MVGDVSPAQAHSRRALKGARGQCNCEQVRRPAPSAEAAGQALETRRGAMQGVPAIHTLKRENQLQTRCFYVWLNAAPPPGAVVTPAAVAAGTAAAAGAATALIFGTQPQPPPTFSVPRKAHIWCASAASAKGSRGQDALEPTPAQCRETARTGLEGGPPRGRAHCRRIGGARLTDVVVSS
jgi:hypothetical protein